MKWLWLCAIVGFLGIWTDVASAAMTLENYSPAKHDRFYTGSDKAFIGAAYDWSGVGLNGSGSWATMVSPSYFLTVNHAHPAINGTLNFYYTNDPDDGYETATVASGTRIGDTDIWVGKLTSEVSSRVAKYPILSLPNATTDSDSDYMNLTVYTFGLSDNANASQNQRLGRNIIERAFKFTNNTDNLTYRYQQWKIVNGEKISTSVGDDESLAVSGDSGAFHCRRRSDIGWQCFHQ